MIIDILKDEILQNIGPLKQAPKGWQKTCCKLCHTQGHGRDTRNRFGIQFNPTSIAVNCFNCGFSAGYSEGKDLSKSFKFFLSHIGIDQDIIKQIDFEIFKNRNKIAVVRDGETVVDIEAKFKLLFAKWIPVDLPKGAKRIADLLLSGETDADFLEVVEYAIRRKILNLNDFYWSPDKSHSLNKRLIIPYYYRNKIVGFTSRLCFDTNSKEIPKYYQQCPTDFVYNLDHQQDWSRKYVIVNEGVLDAWNTDGVAILGELGQSKIDIINRLQKEVIVCPDRDKKGWDLVKAAIDNKWSVAFPKWDVDIKDASKAAEKYGRLLTLHSIIDSVVSDPDRIQLKWKIEQRERERKRK